MSMSMNGGRCQRSTSMAACCNSTAVTASTSPETTIGTADRRARIDLIPHGYVIGGQMIGRRHREHGQLRSCRPG
jgi:hypothetical protein